MKRLTAPWITALATAALLALPMASGAQTPQSQQTPQAQTPPEPQPEQSTTLSTPADADQKDQNAAAAEHLRQAKDALANVDANTVPARAKSELAKLRRHINALERSVAANDEASETGAAQRSAKATSKSRGKANWSNDVAAIDRIITQLAGDGTAATTGAGDPGTAGTTGAEPPSAHDPNKSKTSGAATLDEPARNQLLEVRTHITAFAAAMSGTSAPSSSSAAASPEQRPASGTEPSASNTQPSGSGTQSETSAEGHAGSTSGQAGSTTASQPTAATGQAGSAETGTTMTGSAGQTGSSATATTGQTPEGQTGSTTSSQPGALTGQAEAHAPGHGAAEGNVDAETAKLHLTAARDSLTKLTQLPAAAQLQGNARTQVSQLIQNFNELITTQENWRAAYDKVEANVAALIGPAPQQVSSDPAATAPPTGTPERAPAHPPATEPTDPAATQPTDPAATQPANPPATQPANPQAGMESRTPGAVGTSGTAGEPSLDPAIRQKLVEFRTHLQAFHRAASAGGQQQQ